jgi:hypothetical protein
MGLTREQTLAEETRASLLAQVEKNTYKGVIPQPCGDDLYRDQWARQHSSQELLSFTYLCLQEIQENLLPTLPQALQSDLGREMINLQATRERLERLDDDYKGRYEEIADCAIAGQLLRSRIRDIAEGDGARENISEE